MEVFRAWGTKLRRASDWWGSAVVRLQVKCQKYMGRSGCGLIVPSASTKRRAKFITCKELTESVENNRQCPLQLSSVLFILHFLIFDHFLCLWWTLLSLPSLFQPTCKQISIRPTHSIIHTEHHIGGILEDYMREIGKCLCKQTQPQWHKLNIWQSSVHGGWESGCRSGGRRGQDSKLWLFYYYNN